MNANSRSHMTRVGANYAQLLGSFIVGLFIIRLLLGLGESVYGVIAVLVAGTGLARMLREVLQTGAVPVLGQAWHAQTAGQSTPEKQNFRCLFQAALWVAAAAGVLTVGFFGVLSLALTWFDIPETLRRAASTFIWIRAIQAVVATFLSPILTMILVREKMIAHNALMFAERFFELVAALVTLHWIGSGDPARALVIFAMIACTGTVATQLLATTFLLVREPALRPQPSLPGYTDVRALSSSLGWNAVHALAMNLHLRLDVILMNSCFGVVAGMLFSIAGQAASYVRQLTMGLVVGIDALAARHRSNGQHDRLQQLARRQMTLQAAVVLPAAGALLIAAEPLLALWLRGRLEKPTQSLPELALYCRLLVIGVAARSLSESWMATLTGTGNARRFAPLVLAGALINPIVIAIGIAILPESTGRLLPALSFSAIFLVVHLALIPKVTASFLQVGVRELYRPCAIPLLASIFAAVSLMMTNAITDSTVVSMLTFLSVYGIALAFSFRSHLKAFIQPAEGDADA